jgi:hypothetical protein
MRKIRDWTEQLQMYCVDFKIISDIGQIGAMDRTKTEISVVH